MSYADQSNKPGRGLHRKRMHLSIGIFFYIIGFEIEAKSMHYILK